MSNVNRLYWDDEDGFDEPTMTQHRRSPIKDVQYMLLPDCRHWQQKVPLLDDVEVLASSRLDRPSSRFGHPKRTDWEPDIGFYLDPGWGEGELLVSPGMRLPLGRMQRTGKKTIIYPCPDYGVPENPKRYLRIVAWLVDQAKQGAAVEVGCTGGHGRTGTALASMLILQGMKPRAAIRRVRTSYCDLAVESDRQEKFLNSINRT